MDRIAQLIWDPVFVLAYLVLGSFFTAATGALAWRRSLGMLREAWSVKSTRPRDLPHREAFWAALAASVGVGNLAGVGTALHLGGPGALFWMWVSALVGMSFRLTATYFALQCSGSDPSARDHGTPMSYLERLLPRHGHIAARVLASALLVSGLLNANLIQSNSVAHALALDFSVPRGAVALLLPIGLGVVLVGGLRSIVRLSTAVVPWVLLAYVSAGLLVLASDPAASGTALTSVLYHAIHPHAVAGGMGGYVTLRAVQYGVSRGVFSHGSGTGVAPFFQAANADVPARGAFMAAIVPAVDTLVVCTITGLVILSHGSWIAWTGAHLTVSSFENALGTPGKIVVFLSLATFAFTTVTSWAHFSERCFQYLGGRSLLGYRLAFCLVAGVGPLLPVGLAWSLADILMTVVLTVHLIPLTVLLIRNGPRLARDLEAMSARSGRRETMRPTRVLI